MSVPPTFDVRKAFPPADGSVPLDMVPIPGAPYRSRRIGLDCDIRRPGESIRSHLLRMPVLPIVPLSYGTAPALPVHVMLRDKLVAQSRTIIGSSEHLQVASLISGARSYRLDAHATEAIAITVQHATSTVEQNLDLLSVPPEGLWLEWPEHARYRAAPRRGAAHPVVTGALVVPWPNDPDALTLVTGWMMPDGSVRHSYATAVLHLRHLALRAWNARVRERDHAPASALARLREAFTITLPPGLRGELDALVGIEVEQGDDERRDAEAVRRDAASQAAHDVAPDVPFVLAAMLLLASDSLEVTTQSPIDVLSCLPERVTLGDRWDRLLGRPRQEGFVRRGINEGATARLVRPGGNVPRKALPVSFEPALSPSSAGS